MIKRFQKNHLELCTAGVFLSTYHGDLSLEHSVSTSGGFGGCIPFRVPILFVKLLLNGNVWLNLIAEKILKAKWFILALFEIMFWKLELQRKNWKQGGKMGHSGTSWKDVLEVSTAANFFKQ